MSEQNKLLSLMSFLLTQLPEGSRQWVYINSFSNYFKKTGELSIRQFATLESIVNSVVHQVEKTNSLEKKIQQLLKSKEVVRLVS